MKAKRRVVAGRRVGAIEAEVLDCLWEAEGPLGVREISARMSGRPRAYTTVMTMLTRLIEKGLVRRIPSGRSFVYEPMGTQDELAAGAIREVLDGSGNPQAVLAHFVERIAEDPELLRQLAEIVAQESGR